MPDPFWKKIPGSELSYPNVNDAYYNYPTQKSIAILPEDTPWGAYTLPKGTIIVCFSYMGPASRTIRDFFYLEPDTIAFRFLTTWIISDEYSYSKPMSTSFVIGKVQGDPVDMRIYAVTDYLDESYAPDQTECIKFGEYKFQDADWISGSETILLQGRINWQAYMPDIVINYPYYSHLVVSYTYKDANDVYYLETKYAEIDGYGNLDWHSPGYQQLTLPSEIGNPKSSVVFRDASNVYLHVTGDIQGSAYNDGTLCYGLYNQNLSQSHLVNTDLRDPQICISDSFYLGICTIDANDIGDLVFKYWDGNSLSDAETIDTSIGLAAPHRFSYGLTYRNGLWHTFYWKNSENNIIHRTRLEDTASWEWPAQPEVEEGYALTVGAMITSDAGKVGYMACQNTPSPASWNPNFFGFVGGEISTTSPWDLYYRGDFLFEEPEPGDRREPYVIRDALNLDLAFDTLGISSRDIITPSGNVIKIANATTLSDGTLIFHDAAKFRYFDHDKYYDLSWLTGVFPDDTSRKRLTRVRMNMDTDFSGDISLSIYNENGQTKSISLSESDAGKWKMINLMGRQFFAGLSHSDPESDIGIRDFEFEIQQTQDKI